MPKHSAPWSRFRRARRAGDVRQGLVPRAALEGALAAGACRPFGSHALQRVAQAAGILHHLDGRIALQHTTRGPTHRRIRRRCAPWGFLPRRPISRRRHGTASSSRSWPAHTSGTMHGALRLPSRITSPRRRRASPNPCRTPPSHPSRSAGKRRRRHGRWRRPPCLSSFTHYTGKKRYVHNAAFARKACVWRMRAFPLLCTHAGASAALRARRRNVIEVSGKVVVFCHLARTPPKAVETVFAAPLCGISRRRRRNPV